MYVEDEAFSGPSWQPGGNLEDHLPEGLISAHPTTRLGQSSTIAYSPRPRKGYRAPSRLAFKSTGSETDHRFEEASELPEQAGVQPELSPLIISTKERLETPQPELLPELDDPFTPQPIKEDSSPIPSPPPPPQRSPTPPPPNPLTPSPPNLPADVTMAEPAPRGDLGKVPEPFKGDRKEAAEFLLNLDLFLRMNSGKYNTDKLKI